MKHKHNWQYAEKVERLRSIQKTETGEVKVVEDAYKFVCQCGKSKLVKPKS